MSLQALALPVIAALVVASSAAPRAPALHDHAAPAPIATPIEGKRAFGESCANDADCTSNACSHGKNRSYCSVKCSADTQCPTPPTAGSCNERGYCRAPKK